MGNKTIVMGMLERASETKPARVRATVIPETGKKYMRIEVLSNIERGSKIHSDEAAEHWRMDDRYEHNVVNHLREYVRGNVHTNTLENFS